MVGQVEEWELEKGDQQSAAVAQQCHSAVSTTSVLRHCCMEHGVRFPICTEEEFVAGRCCWATCCCVWMGTGNESLRRKQERER